MYLNEYLKILLCLLTMLLMCSWYQFQLSVLLQAVEAAIPTGVTVNVVPHEEDHEEIRYVPDHELIKLKQELDHMGGPRKK